MKSVPADSTEAKPKAIFNTGLFKKLCISFGFSESFPWRFSKDSLDILSKDRLEVSCCRDVSESGFEFKARLVVRLSVLGLTVSKFNSQKCEIPILAKFNN